MIFEVSAVFMNIVGHRRVCIQLERAILCGRVLHAYIFSGPEYIGKQLVSLEFCRMLGVEFPMRIAPERIEERGKVKYRKIGVETIRKAIRGLGLSVSGDGRRALIIDGAENLSESAQNALLKTIEEPLSGTTIILITHNEGALLPTVISRVERVSFSLVSKEDILHAYPECPESVMILGRPGIAFLWRENLDSTREIVSLFDRLRLFRTLDFGDRFAIAEILALDTRLAERLLSWWAGSVQVEINSATSLRDRIDHLKLLSGISSTLRDIVRFPGSARLILEYFFLAGKNAENESIR